MDKEASSNVARRSWGEHDAMNGEIGKREGENLYMYVENHMIDEGRRLGKQRK